MPQQWSIYIFELDIPFTAFYSMLSANASFV